MCAFTGRGKFLQDNEIIDLTIEKEINDCILNFNNSHENNSDIDK